MNNVKILIIVTLLTILSACQRIDVWDWDNPANTYNEVSFPAEGVLVIDDSNESRLSARLCFTVDNDGDSWNDLVRAEIWFDLEGLPCSICANKIRLQADCLPGKVRYFEVRRGLDKASTVSWSGKYSFDAKLSRDTVNDKATCLAAGDKLWGDWVLRFESEDGNRFLFRVTNIIVK